MSRHQGSSNPALVGKWTASKAEATSWGMPPDKDIWAGLSICAAPFDSLTEDHMRYILLIYDDEKGWATLLHGCQLAAGL